VGDCGDHFQLPANPRLPPLPPPALCEDLVGADPACVFVSPSEQFQRSVPLVTLFTVNSRALLLPRHAHSPLHLLPAHSDRWETLTPSH